MTESRSRRPPETCADALHPKRKPKPVSLLTPLGFPCRIDRIGASWVEWDALHQRTSGWSPFNYELNIRLQRGTESVGVASGQRFVFREDGSLDASPLVGAERTRYLVEDIGISETVVRRVPLDRPVPPRPT